MKIHHQQIFQTVFIFDNCKKTAVKATKYLRYYIFFEKKHIVYHGSRNYYLKFFL